MATSVELKRGVNEQKPSAVSGGRLADFRFAGRLGPLAAFAVAASTLYVAGAHGPLTVLIKLWVAYSVAFILLAAISRTFGEDASWAIVLPASVLGVALGGLSAAAVAVLPDWSALALPAEMFPEWAAGAAFSAFFIGLSLATGEMRHREHMAAEAKRQLVEARLQALTAQIEPHFLMNTLANMRYLIKADGRAAVEMLDHLADFLQGALQRSRSVQTTLGEEMQLVESYLAIMRIRLGDRLRFTISLPEELSDVPFPPLLLQTLVENAVAHGVEPKTDGGMVVLKVDRRGPHIVISVTDDGVGIGDGDRRGNGHGLDNTRERLETFYAGRASFELHPAAPAGTRAAIKIPAVQNA